MKKVTLNTSNEVNESEILTIVAGVLESSNNTGSSFDVIGNEIVEYTADTDTEEGDSIYWHVVNINWSQDSQSILSVDIDC